MKILVSIDGSEPALRAVRHAALLYKQGGISEVVLVNVQPPLAQGRTCAFHSQAELHRSEEEAGEAALRPACQILDEAHATYVKQVKAGEPASTISYAAAANDCQCIVMSKSHGSVLDLLMPTRLANKVQRMSRIPVTLVD